MSKEESLVVVRVTETEFELSDGRIFEHLEPFDIVPSVEEFNETYPSTGPRSSTMNSPDRLIRLDEAANLLALNKDVVRDMADAGKIPHVKTLRLGLA